VLSFPKLELLESRCTELDCPVPYIPGLLSFREIPCILEAWSKLENEPDLILCDGQGIAHPRGLGLASHLGLVLDLPSIGCAKSHLFGKFREPGVLRGDKAPLRGKNGETIGYVLRTRERIKPIFVSPGHLVGVEEAAAITLACSPKYKIPEPLRYAHRLAGLKG
jgi:deoxyribonuclease V